MSESGDRGLDEAGLAVAAPGEAWARVREAKSWDLTARQLCDLELVLNGAFAPLAGFMCAAEYEGVLRAMRLPSGALWPIPVTLDVSEAFAAALGHSLLIAPCLERGTLVALFEPPVAAPARYFLAVAPGAGVPGLAARGDGRLRGGASGTLACLSPRLEGALDVSLRNAGSPARNSGDRP